MPESSGQHTHILHQEYGYENGNGQRLDILSTGSRSCFHAAPCATVHGGQSVSRL